MADQKPNLREAGEKDAKARDQALQAAVTQIEKEFGQGALMKLGDQGALKVVEWGGQVDIAERRHGASRRAQAGLYGRTLAPMR